mgnify:CR=1 FL=1
MTRVTPWPALRDALARLHDLLARGPALDAGLRWQLRALERAVAEERAELLPLVGGGVLSDAVVRWSYDAWEGDPRELTVVALWCCGEGDAEGARRALEAWEGR